MLRGMDRPDDIRAAVDALPLGPLRELLADVDAWVVGGVVRDLLRGVAAPADIDLAVDAELEPLLGRLDGVAGADVRASHARFGTATVQMAAANVDLARTRSETYEHPGALPSVAPAGIEADLARRDFTINAMAVPLAGPGALLDPFGGAADLAAGALRVLHDRSFGDDPTRAIRAARYAARFGFEPEARTRELLAGCDLGTVSADRRDAELARLAAEPAAAEGFRLLAAWGVLDPGAEALDLIAAIAAASGTGPWGDDPALRVEAILIVAAAEQPLDEALALAAAAPQQPSQAVRLAAGHAPAELLIAAAAGGGWVVDYVERWRRVRLLIDGGDLLAAGIPEGPAIGAGLRGALDRKLDGGLDGGRDAELELAVELARGSI